MPRKLFTASFVFCGIPTAVRAAEESIAADNALVVFSLCALAFLVYATRRFR